jgi:hypothetical protein
MFQKPMLPPSSGWSSWDGKKRQSWTGEGQLVPLAIMGCYKYSSAGGKPTHSQQRMSYSGSE